MAITKPTSSGSESLTFSETTDLDVVITDSLGDDEVRATADTVDVTFTFNRNATDVALTDIDTRVVSDNNQARADLGTLGSPPGSTVFTSVYTSTLTLPVDDRGAVVVSFEKNAATDANNANIHGPPETRSHTIPYDTTKPKAAFSRTTTTDDVTVTITFDRDVTLSNTFTSLGVVWDDQNGETGTEGALTNVTANRAWSFLYTFPTASRGVLRLTLLANIATETASTARTGPAEQQTIEIQYDTLTATATTEDEIDIEVSIGVPGSERVPNNFSNPYLLEKYVSTIRFTKADEPVSITNFVIDDIETETSGTATKVSLTAIDLELGAFELLLNFSGVGSVVLTIPADAARSASQGAPTDETSVTIYFDTTGAANNPSGTGVTVLCTTSTTIENNPFGFVQLDGNYTGQIVGEMECVERDGFLYGVSQVQYRRAGRDGELNEQYQASAALWCRNLTDCALTILKRYSDITVAARSLKVVDDDVFFFEGSHYAYEWSPRNREWHNLIGNVMKINTSNTIEKIGFAFRSQGPTGESISELFHGIHGGTASPFVTAGNDLYLIPGFGDLKDITDGILDKNGNPTATAAQVNNWSLLKYSESLDLRLEVLETNEQTGQHILEMLSRVTNSFFFVGTDGKLNFEPKLERTAQVSTAISTTSTDDIAFKNPNRELSKYPASGTLLIGNECLTYRSISEPNFSGIQRSQHNTVAESHAINDKITLINHVFDLQNPSQVVEVVEDINIESYYQFLYNVISINYAGGSWKAQENRASSLEASFKDETSITRFTEEKLQLDLPELNYWQGEWVDWIGENYLQRYKNLESMMTINLQPSWYLKLGEVVLLREKINSNIFRVGQIVDINHTFASQGASTTIKIFTFSV